MRLTFTLMAVLLATATSALTVRKATVMQLTQDASLVVVGKIVSQAAYWEDGNIYTDVTVAIDQCYKGSPEGKTLVVKNYGGTVGETSQVVAGAPEFVPGDEVVLFLISWKGEYWIHSIALGEFAIVIDAGERYAVNDLSHVGLVDPATNREITQADEKITKVKLETLIQQVKAFARQ